MAAAVKLIGLDFGTTTSSAVIAAGQLNRTATGRMELEFQEEIFRAEMVFTPMLGDERIDVDEIERLLDVWLAAGQVREGELFGGGALLTGLTAQMNNASALVSLIRRRLGDTLVATADDPCLESWLAFMGNCASLSREHPDKHILNLDIGGGTTNLALGQDRQVLRTGCLYLGARHVQVVPGSYRIVKLSSYARELFDHLGIAKGPGDELTDTEVAAVIAFYVMALEASVNSPSGSTRQIVQRLEQVPFRMPDDVRAVVVTFSGGVGELIYRHLQGEPWPTPTYYGDLGIDLAQRIVQSSIWADSLRDFRPKSAGRATVYGLLRHTTEVSGNTLFLSDPNLLPLTDMPILGNLYADSSESQIRDVLTLVRHSSRGGGVQVRLWTQQAASVRRLGQCIADVLQQSDFPATHPLVMLVRENVGRVLGQYITCWGKFPLQLLVIDEMAQRDAQYVQIGLPRDQVVPVSYYGFLPTGKLT
ncbi:MAG: reactivating factor for ethanolamine ammonia lyase [Gemmataceae bacterium]|nr:reactivating factor for ethanolamine ammonia lyase [Gemmataceae bacterium]